MASRAATATRLHTESAATWTIRHQSTSSASPIGGVGSGVITNHTQLKSTTTDAATAQARTAGVYNRR